VKWRHELLIYKLNILNSVVILFPYIKSIKIIVVTDFALEVVIVSVIIV
jgi:hypothetical protein